MAEIDNTIALGVKPQPTQDVIGPITSLAQLQYLQAHGALESAQAQFQQGKIRAIGQLSDAVASGTPIEKALPGSTYGLYDPTGANAVLGNVGTGRTLNAYSQYATSQNPSDVSILGPKAVSDAATASQDLATLKAKQQYAATGDPNALRAGGPELVGQGQTAAKTAGDVQIQKLSIAGQVANGVLAMGDVNGQMPPGGLPPQIRADAVAKLKSAGLITDAEAKREASMSDADFWNTAKSLAARAQTATEAATSSGRASAAQEAGKAANTPIQVSPGNSVQIPNAATLPASGGASPNYFGVVSQHESGNNPSAVNPNGGAAGLYQFMPGTWQQLRQSHPELGLTPNGATDPAQATKAMQAFTMDNAKVLSSNGIPVTDKSLFMSHFLGAGGAVKFLQAGAQNPNMPAAQIFPQEAKQNPTIFYNGSTPRTIGEVYGMMTRQFGNGLTATNIAPGPAAGFTPQPMAMPAAASGAAPAAPQTALQSASALPVPALTPAPQAQGSGNPLAPTAPTQGTVAPIVDVNSGMKVLSPGMSLQEKAAAETTGSKMAEIQTDQFKKAKSDYDAANAAQMKLGELQASLDELPSSGLLTPGAGASERLGWAKLMNTALQAAGQKPIIDPSQVAGAEAAQKITGNLGFDLSRSLGSKEAASITEQAIKLNPGIENSPYGARVVAGAINAGLQRQKDFYQYLSESGNAAGADLKFNKENPHAKYVKEANEIARVPSQAIKMLQSNPSLAPMFDQKYGSGLSRYFTGQ